MLDGSTRRGIWYRYLRGRCFVNFICLIIGIVERSFVIIYLFIFYVRYGGSGGSIEVDKVDIIFVFTESVV